MAPWPAAWLSPGRHTSVSRPQASYARLVSGAVGVGRRLHLAEGAAADLARAARLISADSRHVSCHTATSLYGRVLHGS